MVLYRLLNAQGVFQPEQVAMMGDVFEDVLKTLGLVDRQDSLVDMIARKIIELAQTGVLDRVRLMQMTLEAFDGKPPQSSAA
jgi:hypothetical protein